MYTRIFNASDRLVLARQIDEARAEVAQEATEQVRVQIRPFHVDARVTVLDAQTALVVFTVSRS